VTAITHTREDRDLLAATHAFLRSPRFFWLALALFLVAHVVLRLWETPNLAKNDVQEAIAAQSWAWGYHPRNPPLHTWLLMSSYALFGVRLAAHVFLRYALLGLTIAFAYLCGRRLVSHHTWAALGALSLSLLAPFAWTVHTALTHTLLLAAVNLAALWSLMRLTSKRRAVDYAVFGLIVAMGLLAKYSFALFLLPMLGATWLQPELRPALMDRRIWLSAGVAALALSPHALWMLEARFDFIGFLADKQRSVTPQPYWRDLLEGLGALAYAALNFLIPLLLVFAAAFWRSFKAKPTHDAGPWERAIAQLVFLSLGLLVLDVMVLRATAFEQRYMMCALIAAPLWAWAWLERRAPSPRALAGFALGAIVVGLVVFAGLVGRAELEQRTCRRCWEEMAASELVSEVRFAGFVDGTIIADHYNVAGNMRLAFPNARIYAANYDVPQSRFAGPGACLLVWDARNSGDALPESLAATLAERGLAPQGAPVYVDAPLRRSQRMDRLAYWLVPNADANCATNPASPAASTAPS
jgi:4-amino-4-deoxy-L-arabinose transferase-like glycosyltransferase